MAAAAEHVTGARARDSARFLDDGQPGWRPFVFFGGLGTDLDAFYATEFARPARERLQVRAISVERNGFGMTAFDPTLGYADGVDDVLDVLASRGVNRFAVVAISGGAPFATALYARVPERVLSRAYLYWGADDDVVPAAHVVEWRRVLRTVDALRAYLGEGHDVQYHHWEQILDVAGLGTLETLPEVTA